MLIVKHSFFLPTDEGEIREDEEEYYPEETEEDDTPEEDTTAVADEESYGTCKHRCFVSVD